MCVYSWNNGNSYSLKDEALKEEGEIGKDKSLPKMISCIRNTARPNSFKKLLGNV